jgi:iron complex transport system ATP-binding protein
MLTAKGLFKKYREKTILQKIDFHVSRGEALGIIGPNGSGKSTLLKLLVGEETPDAGEIWLDDRLLSSYSPRERAKKIAILAQENISEIPFRVEQVVQMGRYPYESRLFGEDKSGIQVVEQALEQTAIAGLRKHFLPQISGGERQRTFLARALAQQPQIFLLDEPTTYLDLYHQQAILDLLTHLRKQHGIALIMVLHDLNLAAQYCDRLLVLKKGEVVSQGTPAEVMKESLLKEVFGIEATVFSHPTLGVPQLLLTPREQV